MLESSIVYLCLITGKKMHRTTRLLLRNRAGSMPEISALTTPSRHGFLLILIHGSLIRFMTARPASILNLRATANWRKQRLMLIMRRIRTNHACPLGQSRKLNPNQSTTAPFKRNTLTIKDLQKSPARNCKPLILNALRQ